MVSQEKEPASQRVVNALARKLDEVSGRVDKGFADIQDIVESNFKDTQGQLTQIHNNLAEHMSRTALLESRQAEFECLNQGIHNTLREITPIIKECKPALEQYHNAKIIVKWIYRPLVYMGIFIVAAALGAKAPWLLPLLKFIGIP